MTTPIPSGVTEWSEIDKDACVENVRVWLTEHYIPSENFGGRVHGLRKIIVTSLLSQFNAARVKDLTDKQIVNFMKALGLEAPGKPEHMPGLGTPYTPGPRQAMPCPAKEPYEPKTNPMERLRESMRAKAEAKLVAEDEADQRGELWAVVAAYHRDSTFMIIRQGRMTDARYEAFYSQHTDASAHLETYYMIGSITEVRGKAAQMFHGTSTKDLTIRVIMKQKD